MFMLVFHLVVLLRLQAYNFDNQWVVVDQPDIGV